MDYRAALNFFGSDDSYLLSTHMNADGDGIGALLALGGMLDRLGRTYRIVVDDETLDRKFSFLAGFDRIERFSDLPDHLPVPYAVFVDTPTLSAKRVGDVALMVDHNTHTLIIDHHAGNSEEGDVVLIDSEASAASELVYRLIQASEVSIHADIATQIYTGIAFDTKLFKYSHPERALKVCAELVDFGVDPQQVAEALFSHQTRETVRTLGLALSSLELSMDGRISTLFVDHQTYALGGDLDPVVDHAISIDGVEVALFFKEEAPGRHRISLRSRGLVNVNLVARAFGGGGHDKASGCVIEAPLEAAKRRVLAEVKSHLMTRNK